MGRQVQFRIVQAHPIETPLHLEDDERVSRVEWGGRGYVTVIIVKDPRPTK